MNEKEIEKMKTFEAAMWLKDLKAGETVTERHVEGVERLLGKLLEPLRKTPLTRWEISFPEGKTRVTKDGVPSIGEISVIAPKDSP